MLVDQSLPHDDKMHDRKEPGLAEILALHRAIIRKQASDVRIAGGE